MLDAEQLRAWFEDASVDLVKHWLAHPATMAAIDFDGYANGGDGVRKQGFQLLAAGQREAWEPRPPPTPAPPPTTTPHDDRSSTMRLDGQRTYGTDDVVDVVVVGTGAGGAPLLASLARRGLRSSRSRPAATPSRATTCPTRSPHPVTSTGWTSG